MFRCNWISRRVRRVFSFKYRLCYSLLPLVIFFLGIMWGVERHMEDDNPCGEHNHVMVFHSCVCAEILFNGWATTNAAQLFGSAVAIFVASALYEWFKSFREELTRKPEVNLSDSQTHLAKTQISARKAMLNIGHGIQTLMHAVQSTLSYLLMLVFMTYNVWLCLAVVLGLTFGYFLFGWRRSAGSAINDSNEHCQ